MIGIPEAHLPLVQGKNQKSAAPPIAGLHSATALLRSLEETQSLLTASMGMKLHEVEGNRYRFKMKSDSCAGCFYDVVIDEKARNGRQGGGTVHHTAFRASTDDELKRWQKVLADSGFSVTPIRDRKYFKSIYFHEPGGVLFEIATDSPGFAMDEPYERLGSGLKLPDQYESIRTEIESRLPKLHATDAVNSNVAETVN